MRAEAFLSVMNATTSFARCSGHTQDFNFENPLEQGSPVEPGGAPD
jgi:hypothetical protein